MPTIQGAMTLPVDHDTLVPAVGDRPTGHSLLAGKLVTRYIVLDQFHRSILPSLSCRAVDAQLRNHVHLGRLYACDIILSIALSTFSVELRNDLQ